MATGGRAATGEIGLASAALVAIPKLLDRIAETKLGDNRFLAPYSGKISMGFAQLELGDMHRNLKLARSVEGSALTLAREVDGLREGQLGIDKLTTGLGNRLGIAAAAFIGPGFREVGNILGGLADRIEKVDPGGRNTQGAVEGLHDWVDGKVGWLLGLAASGGSLSEAEKMAKETLDQLHRERVALAGKAPPIDPWSQFMIDARNLPNLAPARPLRP